MKDTTFRLIFNKPEDMLDFVSYIKNYQQLPEGIELRDYSKFEKDSEEQFGYIDQIVYDIAISVTGTFITGFFCNVIKNYLKTKKDKEITIFDMRNGYKIILKNENNEVDVSPALDYVQDRKKKNK